VTGALKYGEIDNRDLKKSGVRRKSDRLAVTQLPSLEDMKLKAPESDPKASICTT
jgi:hypothetical protein